MWLPALGSIGTNALQSWIGGRSAYKQQQANIAMQQAQAYNSAAREYAQLTASIKSKLDYNEALTKAEAYTFANTLSNQGALQLRDAQLRGVMARNKLQLRTDGQSNIATIRAEAGAVGAVGASVKAVQQSTQKKVNEAMTALSQQRENQVYDMHRQNQAMWTQFYQNQQMIDDSEIDEAFLPRAPVMIGGGAGGGGKFLPHLIASSIGFGANHYQQQWALGLSGSNQQPTPVFSQGGGTATAYPYRR